MNSKRIIRYTLMLAMLGTPAVLADDTMGGNTTSDHAQMDKGNQTASMLARASKLIGTNIYNDAGESLGEINELVLTGGENRVSYAVLSFGGWMGIGDKLFAIPWSQFEQKGTDKNKLYLNVAKDTLKNAPGFDKNHWPESADKSYWQSVDKFYPNREKDMHTDAADAAHRADANAQSATADNTAKANTPNTPQEDGLAWSRKVSEVIGADITNSQKENLGDVKDLVIDTSSGRVRYAVVSFGGWLGIGDKLFAVPMSALQGQSGKENFVMNVTKDQMKNAPGFDDKSWPDFASPQWGATNDAFYDGQKTSSQAARE